MNSSFKYDWGELVQVIETAPSIFQPGENGSVCGMREKEDIHLYLVEFKDGSALEIDGKYLQPVEQS